MTVHLDALEVLLVEATPGKWACEECTTGKTCWCRWISSSKVPEGVATSGALAAADAALIVAMREALPGLIAEAREAARLRALFDAVGQGEYNVLALIDHYQEAADEARDVAAAALSKGRAEGLAAADIAEMRTLLASQEQPIDGTPAERIALLRSWFAGMDPALSIVEDLEGYLRS